MTLRTYRKKRNFRVTQEPAGSRAARRATPSLIYVVQKHQARVEDHPIEYADVRKAAAGDP